MNSINKSSRVVINVTTHIWSFLLLLVSLLIYTETEIHKFNTLEILIEFTKALTLWYVLAILSAFIIDRNVNHKE